MQKDFQRCSMRTFDYSFLESGLLPAGLVNIVSAIARLREREEGNETAACGSDCAEQPATYLKTRSLLYTPRRQPHYC